MDLGGLHYSAIFILLTLPISADILIVLALFQNSTSLLSGIFHFLININISCVYYQLFCKTPGQVNTSTDPELHHLNLFLDGAWHSYSLVAVILYYNVTLYFVGLWWLCSLQWALWQRVMLYLFGVLMLTQVWPHHTHQHQHLVPAPSPDVGSVL